MHRQQKPHSTTTHNNNKTTSPPSSKKRSPFHRYTTSSSPPSPTSTTTTTSSRPAAKRGLSLYHRKSASAHQLFHRPHKSKLLGAGSGPASLPASKAIDDMATSFLQYCAMCEKQITVPSNSVLYCSESCRRKDSCKPLSASSYTYTMTTTTPSFSHADQPPSPAMSSFTRIPSDLHFSKSDLDPTEWKPVIHGYDFGRGAGHAHNNSSSSSTSLAASPSSNSDAWAFLSQFHTPATSSFSSSSPLPPLLVRRPTQPQHLHHRSNNNSSTSLSALSINNDGTGTGTSASTIAGLPSLVNTPTNSTSASSVTSSSPPVPSSSSAASDYIGAAYYMYDTATRPLPPRHNPSFTAARKGGVELVVPHIIAPGSSSNKKVPTAATTAAITVGVGAGDHVGIVDDDDDDDDADDVDDDDVTARDGGLWLRA